MKSFHLSDKAATMAPGIGQNLPVIKYSAALIYAINNVEEPLLFLSSASSLYFFPLENFIVFH